MAELGFATSLDNSELQRQAEEAKNTFTDISRKASEEGNKIDNAFRRFGKAIAGYFSIRAAADFARQIVNVRGEVESLEVSFKTLLGDEKKAVDLMSDIRKFAAATPMNMGDLAKGAQMLLGFNLEAEKVMPTLQALGDISMGDAQKFNSLTLAFAQMSSTGKLMGQDLLQMINAGFNPLAVISEHTGKSIGVLKEEMAQGAISADMVTQAFMAATAEGGKFNGMLEKQSYGIRGSLSNLQGAIEDMFNDLGEKIQDPVTDSLNALQKLIQNYETVGKVIGTLVATYGGYKAAVMACYAALVVSTNLTKGYTVAQQIEYVWLLLVEKAQKMLNKTMLKNPYILAATALIGLVSALVMFKKRASEAEKAQQRLNDAVEGSKQRTEALKQETNDLIGVLDDETATEAQHKAALDKLKEIYPDLLKDCKTYNDYLEKRIEILDSMPVAQEEKENEVLRERINIEESLLGLQKKKRENIDAAYKSGGIDYDTGMLQGEYAKTEQQLNSQIKTLLDEGKKYFADFDKAVEEGYKGTLEKYIKESHSADKQVLNDRLALQRQAAFDAKPIEQRIEITENSIRSVEGKINALKQQQTATPWNITIGANISFAERQLSFLRSQLDELNAQNAAPKKVNFGAEVRKAQAELSKARNAYKANATEANKAAVSDAEAALDDAKKAYKAAYGKEYDQAVKASQDRLKVQQDANEALKQEQEAFSKWMLHEVRQQALDEEQARIDAMAQGFEREKAQIDLDNQRRLAAYDDYKEDLLEKVRDLAEAQWNAQNAAAAKSGRKFDRSSITLGNISNPTMPALDGVNADGNATIYNAMLQANKAFVTEEANIGKQYEQDQHALYEKQLEGIKTYLQQREAIEKEFAAKRAALYDDNGNLKSGATQGNVAELNRQEDNAKTALDEQFAQRSDEYQRWCNDVASLTYEQLAVMLEQVQAQLAAMEGADGVDEQQLAETRAKVETLTTKIALLGATSDSTTAKIAKKWQALSPQVAEVIGVLDEIGDTMLASGNESVQAAGEYVKAASTILDSGKNALDAVAQLAMGTATSIQNATQSATAAMTATATGAATAMSTLEKASIILSIISAAYTIVQAVINLVKSAQAKEHEQLLNDIEGQIDDLGDSYDTLEKQAERTFGASNAEIRRQQIELKKAQIELLKTAMAEEKAQKNPDESKLDEWQDQINAISGEIDALSESATNAIFGEDINTAIENFADALTDAWAAGESASEAANKYMRNMMKQTVMQAILDYTQASQRIQAIRDQLDTYLADGIISSEEQAHLEGMAQQLMDEVSQQFEWAQGLFDDSEREGSKKGIATASQESVDENNGRLTFIQGAITVVKEHTANISENSNLLRDNVSAITSCILRIEHAINTMKTTLSDMQTQGVRIRS